MGASETSRISASVAAVSLVERIANLRVGEPLVDQARHVADGVRANAGSSGPSWPREQALRLAADRRLGVDDPEEDLLLATRRASRRRRRAAARCPATGRRRRLRRRRAPRAWPPGPNAPRAGVLAHAGSARTREQPASKTEITTVPRAWQVDIETGAFVSNVRSTRRHRPRPCTEAAFRPAEASPNARSSR